MSAGKTTKKDPYKSVRKPMPPPERVEPDRRDAIEREEARREIERYSGHGNTDEKARAGWRSGRKDAGKAVQNRKPRSRRAGPDPGRREESDHAT